MGFDGKSLINPKQIRFVHQVFAPTEKEVRQAEKIIRATGSSPPPVWACSPWTAR